MTEQSLDVQIKEIEDQIHSLERELSAVHGEKTEVYSRIVGYYRNVDNWNDGKKEEFALRKDFDIRSSAQTDVPDRKQVSDSNIVTGSKQVVGRKQVSVDDDKDKVKAVLSRDNDCAEDNTGAKASVTYLFYSKSGCDNCKAVRSMLSLSCISGREINADTEEGLSQAAMNGVFCTPTVIFFNERNEEIMRVFTQEELEECLSALGSKSA